MSPFEWDVTLETGDTLVDRQHKAIHQLFNELEQSADDPSEVMRVLDYLTEHVLLHFMTEEDLMDRMGYPSTLTNAHIAEHKALTEATRAKVVEFRAGELRSTQPLLEFLRSWLSTHVYEWDRDLIDFVQRLGGAAQIPKGADEPQPAQIN